MEPLLPCILKDPGPLQAIAPMKKSETCLAFYMALSFKCFQISFQTTGAQFGNQFEKHWKKNIAVPVGSNMFSASGIERICVHDIIYC